MTRNDDDSSIFDSLNPDLDTDTDLDEQEEQDEQDSGDLDDFLFDDPEDEGQDGDEQPAQEEPAAPAAGDDRFNRLLDMFEKSLTPQAQMPAPTQDAYVDPFERPDNKARLAALKAEAVYDPDKLEEWGAFHAELLMERMEHRTAQRFAQQTAMQSQVGSLGRARDAHYAEVTATYAFVDKGTYDEAVDEFIEEQFEGNQANFALALNDKAVGPKLKKALRQAAVALATDKRLQARKPGVQKKAPAQPARRTAQQPSVPARREARYETEDVDYMALAERAYFAKPKARK